jgi:hypothetical protein
MSPSHITQCKVTYICTFFSQIVIAPQIDSNTYIYLRLRCLAERCTCSLLIRLSTDVSCTTTLQVMMEERCTPPTAPPPSCTPSLNPTVRYDDMMQHTQTLSCYLPFLKAVLLISMFNITNLTSITSRNTFINYV